METFAKLCSATLFLYLNARITMTHGGLHFPKSWMETFPKIWFPFECSNNNNTLGAFSSPRIPIRLNWCFQWSSTSARIQKQIQEKGNLKIAIIFFTKAVSSWEGLFVIVGIWQNTTSLHLLEYIFHVSQNCYSCFTEFLNRTWKHVSLATKPGLMKQHNALILFFLILPQ